MAGSIGTLHAKLALDAQGLYTGLNQAQSKLGSFSASVSKIGSLAKSALAGIGAGLSFAGLGAAIKSTIDDTGRLVDVASKLDIGVGKLEQLELAAKTSGISAETLHTGIGKLQQKIGEAAGGNKEAIADFERLGFSWRQLAAQDPADTFTQVAMKVGSAADTYNRAADAAAAFGARGGRELIPLLRDFRRELDLAVKAVGELTDEQAQKLDEMGDAWTRFEARVSSTKRRALVGTIEGVESLVRGPQELLSEKLGAMEKSFKTGDLEKQLRFAKELATADEGAVSRLGMGPGRFGVEGAETWTKAVEQIQAKLGEFKAAKVEALSWSGFEDQNEMFEESWHKWAQATIKDTQSVMDKIGDLKFALKEGFLDRGTFDEAVMKALGQKPFENDAFDRFERITSGKGLGAGFKEQADNKLARLDAALEGTEHKTEMMTAATAKLNRELANFQSDRLAKAFEETRGPLERFKGELKDLDIQIWAGRPDLDLAGGALQRARGNAILDLEKSIGGLTNRGDVGAMQKGSVEAASVINRFLNEAGRERDPQERVAAILEQAKQIQLRQVDLQERMANALENLGVG